MVNIFSLFANSDINCTLCFCFFVLKQKHKYIFISLFYHFPYKNMVIRSCAPLCRSMVYPSWVLRCGVWDCGGMTIDAGKSRIMCLCCECRCLRRIKGLSKGWGWAGCIGDSMELWGIRIQWIGCLMGGEILRSGWGVVMSWWGGRVSGGGMLGGEC